MVSRGTPAQFTPTKGSWGDRYLIEKNTTPRKRVSCADCKHYCEDGSCLKEAVIISEVGYNNWKNCKSFVLSNTVEYYSEKVNQVLKTRKTPSIDKQKTEDFEKKSSRGEKSGINYWGINEEMKALFKDCYLSPSSQAKKKCMLLVPLELFEGYKKVLDFPEDKLYEDSLAVFVRKLGVDPGKREIHCMRRKSLVRMTEMLFSGKYIGFCESTFTDLFIDFFAEYLHIKKVY